VKLFLLLSIIVVIADRISKFLIFKNFSLGSPYPLIKGILYITPTFNKGIAFGLFRQHSSVIFIIISLVTVFLIIYILSRRRPKSPLLKLALFLILSGAIGNLIDRIIYGSVMDFIDFKIWPVFNVADSAVTIGACLLIFYMFRTRQSK
jgi:signal peptidase II